jgi:hypothetical protein
MNPAEDRVTGTGAIGRAAKRLSSFPTSRSECRESIPEPTRRVGPSRMIFVASSDHSAPAAGFIEVPEWIPDTFRALGAADNRKRPPRADKVGNDDLHLGRRQNLRRRCLVDKIKQMNPADGRVRRIGAIGRPANRLSSFPTSRSECRESMRESTRPVRPRRVIFVDAGADVLHRCWFHRGSGMDSRHFPRACAADNRKRSPRADKAGNDDLHLRLAANLRRRCLVAFGGIDDFAADRNER